MSNLFPSFLGFCLATVASLGNATSQLDPSIGARLASCDASVVRTAAQDVLRDDKTLREPLVLLEAASGERVVGNREEAAFLYLAGQLRTRRQMLFQTGDRPQLFDILTTTVGSLITPALVADPELMRRVVQRVIEWDRVAQDPYRNAEAAKSIDISRKLSEIDAELAGLPDRARNDPVLIAKAEQIERQVQSMRAQRCGPGTLDAVDAELATKRIKADSERLVMTHPLGCSAERAGA